MAAVKDYYPGDFWGDIKQSLAWLYSRQNIPIGNWQGNALGTATTQQLEECGLVSTADLSTFAQSAVENIVIDPPAGVLPDTSTGPDGFPINFSPLGLPQGNALLNTFQSTGPILVQGRCFSLLQLIGNYRVDVFSRTDLFYYQGSSLLGSASGNITWSLGGVAAGAVLAVLYPTTVPQPSVGASFTTVPAGWVAHSNMGTGQTLSAYFARLFVKTDIEYLQEDNVPIIVQDANHARAGSSAIPGPGTMTVHIIFIDPVAGPTSVFNSLQNLAAFSDLPRSFAVPTADPLYVPDVTALAGAAALQNRSYIYDDALFMLAACAAGNFSAAAKVVKRLNSFLDNPGYLASLILENGEDSNSAARWTKSNINDTISDINDPSQPPYGTGLVVQFQNALIGDSFTYSGTGFPDTTDNFIQWTHKESSASISFIFDISVTSSLAKVTDIKVTSNSVALAGVSAPAAPSLSQVAGGTIAATTYFVQVTYLMSNGETVASTEASLAVSANNLLQVASPASAAGAIGWAVYVSTASGSETRQVSSIAIGTAWTEPTTGLVSGALPPVSQNFNATTKTITVPVGTALNVYRGHLLNLANLISTLASDTLVSIAGFKITMNGIASQLMFFDNLSVGTLQPQDSLSFSYDIYNGLIDQAYIRTGAMAWVCYAYAIYMQLSLDYSPVLYLQRMLNRLLALQSFAMDLTNGLLYGGYGKYQDPGYQFVPGQQLFVSTEHNADIYFAFKRAALVLPTAAIQLQKAGTITAAQATSLSNTASTVSLTADTISTQLTTVLYIAPSSSARAASTAYTRGAQITDSNGNFQKCVIAGTSGSAAPVWPTTLGATIADGTVTWELASLAGFPGHFAQGATGSTLDTSQALDACGTWAALFAHAIGDDTKATECMKFVYQKFYLTNQTIALSGTVLENGNDGNTAARWSKTQPADQIVDVNDPLYDATLLVARFLAASAGDVFTYTGTGFPDTIDGYIRWQHKEDARSTFVFDISVTSSTGKVTDIQVTSDAVGPATYNSVTKVITLPVGPGASLYRSHLLNLTTMIPGTDRQLTAETLVSITGFKITINAASGLMFFNMLTVTKSSNFNLTYQQATKFSGFKVYNDSVGGYSGSPLAVWQEGTWGMINALLCLHDVSSVSAYFASVQGSIDSFLTTLITDQRVVRSTSGDGSFLNYALAARGLPWEFQVWPMLSATAWFYLVSVNPSLVWCGTAAGLLTQSFPFLFIPQGQGQQVSELDGHTSIAGLDVEAIDPAGVLKGLASQSNLVGKIARLKLGFPGQSLGDFVTLSTVQIVSAGWSHEGRVRFHGVDIQRFLRSQLWLNGGPRSWTPGQPASTQPVGVSVAANAFPVSAQNIRWISGNPIDIYLAALQNELGVGQDPLLPQAKWALYSPGNDSTLINPNPYLDVPGILALRNTAFSGDWFEFKVTRPIEGKLWLEDQILKVLGLYMIVRADGRLSLKSMKSPQSAALVMALNEKNIKGIPEFDRLNVINQLTVRFGVDVSDRETAAREFRNEVTFQQVTSIAQYKQQFKYHIEAEGLTPIHGGLLRGFLMADRIFRRHAFATPKYKVQSFLSTLTIELGDFVWLNHRLLPDFQTGNFGLTNVVCEVIGRTPNYADGHMEFELLDTRFMNLTKPFQIAPVSAAVPTWSNASGAQRQTYMFISAAPGGTNADGSAGNTIF